MSGIGDLRNSTNVRKIIEIATWRALFALGGVFAPAATANHAARLFATPFANSRNRARAFESNDVVSRADFHRRTMAFGSRTLSMYVWGDPRRERYALLVHGWSSFGLRFASWVARLRAAGYAVVAFDQPAHGNSHARWRRCRNSPTRCARSANTLVIRRSRSATHSAARR